MNAYDSDAVVALFDDWRPTVFHMIRNVGLIDLEKADREKGNSSFDFGQPYRALNDLRPVKRERRTALVKQVKAELRTCRPHPYAWLSRRGRYRGTKPTTYQAWADRAATVRRV